MHGLENICYPLPLSDSHLPSSGIYIRATSFRRSPLLPLLQLHICYPVVTPIPALCVSHTAPLLSFTCLRLIVIYSPSADISYFLLSFIAFLLLSFFLSACREICNLLSFCPYQLLSFSLPVLYLVLFAIFSISNISVYVLLCSIFLLTPF